MDLSDAQLDCFEIYLDRLLKWNSRINLTSVRQPEEIVTRHFGESLFAAMQLFPGPIPESVIDVGSGAGFPGIPIKIWNQAAVATLIESNQKKAVFLREAVRTLNLRDVSIATSRAESMDAKSGIVTLRAVENFTRILPTARKLLRDHGRLALLIGEAQVEAAKASLSDLVWQEPIRIPLSTNRSLLIGASS